MTARRGWMVVKVKNPIYTPGIINVTADDYREAQRTGQLDAFKGIVAAIGARGFIVTGSGLMFGDEFVALTEAEQHRVLDELEGRRTPWGPPRVKLRLIRGGKK